MPTPNSWISNNNMTLPPEGPRTVPVNIDFSVLTEQSIDFTQSINNGWISYISGVYFDNSANANDVTLKMDGSNQSIIIPASKQGWFPILATNPPVFTVSQASTGDVCKLQFLNFPVFPYVVGDGGGIQDVNVVSPDPLPVSSDGPTISDYGIASMSGSSEELFTAGEANKYALIYNPTGNNTVYVNLAGGTADSGDIPIVAGQSLELANGVANAVNIIGTAAETLIAVGGA